jgi:hypothetical protein
VACVALDDVLADRRVDVVKIDVQGADHDVVAGMRRTLQASPHAPVLAEFWIEGMAERGVDPLEVLAAYRALRPLGLLRDGGRVVEADDAEIMAATEWEGHWVNLVLRARKPQ